MRSLALLAGSVLLFGFATQEVNLPAPLAGHFDKLTSAQSLTATYTFRVVGEAPTDYELSLSKPNLFKLSSADGFVLSDGKNIYTYTKSTNEYTQVPVTDEGVAAFAMKPELFAWAPFFLKKASEQVGIARAGGSRTVQGNEVTEVNVTLKKNSTTANLFIDKKVGVARGDSLRIGEKEYLATASKIELSKDALGTDVFAFSAPDGAKKVEPTAKADASFASVQGILTANCMPCHGAANPRGGVNLSSYDGILATVTPGNAASSELTRSMRASGPGRMPLNRAPVADEKIKLIETWINNGAQQK